MKTKKRSPLAMAPNVHILGQPKPRIVRPFHDWHILKEVPGITHSAGGIEIPENKRVPECEIIASGPGRLNAMGVTEPMFAQVGQRVLYEGIAKPYGVIDGIVCYAVRDVQLVGWLDRNPADVESAPAGEEKAS